MESKDAPPSVADNPAWWGGRIGEEPDWDLYDQFDYEDNYLDWSEDELAEYANSQYEHTCVIQETPDGMGCVTCLYG